MHTVISSFTQRAAAERTIDRLVEAGVPRGDIHIEHCDSAHEPPPPLDNASWDGMEREVAVDRNVLASVGHFFTSLFGQDNPSGHVASYSQAVEQGGCVLVADAPDEAVAERAREILLDLGGSAPHAMDRREMHHRPVRDIVAARQFTTQTMEHAGRRESVPGGSTPRGVVSSELDERAFAQGEGRRPVTPQAGEDSELERSPGLRYADKDKPG